MDTVVEDIVSLDILMKNALIDYCDVIIRAL
jgi:hypothetical protein